MEIQQKPDYLIFAEGSKSGELSDFPDIERGWGVTLEQTQAKPPLEWMSSAFNRIDKNTLYLLQQGVPEWSESVLYPIGAIIKVGGTLYEAKTQNTNLNPASSSNDWKLVVRFQDATTKQKGIVQLNSDTNSTSETQAATPKAVKTAHDLASGAMPKGTGGIGLDTQTATSNINIDTYAFKVGFYSGSNWSSTKGLPFGSTSKDVWFYLINQNLASDGDDYKLQILGLNQTGTPRLAMRYKVKGIWTDWSEFASKEDVKDLGNDFQVIYPNGSESNPPTLTNNQRVVIEKPFKTSNCYAVTELYLKNQVSGEMEWFTFDSVNKDNAMYGVLANVSESQIVVQTARDGLVAAAYFDCNPWGATSIIKSAPFRVRAIKLGN